MFYIGGRGFEPVRLRVARLYLHCNTSEVLLYIGGRGLQIIEPVTFARCAFIIALRNIALDGYLRYT